MSEREGFLPIRYSNVWLEEVYRHMTIDDQQRAFDLLRLRIAEGMVAIRDLVEDGAPSEDLLALLFNLYDEVEELDREFKQLLKVRRIGARLYYVSEEVSRAG